MRRILLISLIVVAILSLGLWGISLMAEGNQTWEENQAGDTAAAGNDTHFPSILNQTLVTPDNDPILAQLLAQDEQTNRTFEKFKFRDGDVVYHYQRMIGNAIVGFDGITYILDEKNNLIDKVIRWRDDLPDTLPPIIPKEEAESIGGGKAVELLYIDPVLDDIFASIQPTPTNPCWIVYVYNAIDNFTYVSDIVVVDAVGEEILGHGTPPPSYGYVLTGPVNTTICGDSWLEQAENALYWFNTMGYAVPDIAVYPDDNAVKETLQDTDVVLFYEVSHGNSWEFYSGCGNTTTSYEIRDWLESYREMPFAFLTSCESQCYSGMITSETPSLSYALRKGSYIGTATIGFCGLTNNPDAWRQELQWQDKFFQMANNGDTVKESFDSANKYYQATAQCSRLAGDSSLKLVPSIKHRKPYSGDLEGIVSFRGRDKSYDRWVEEFEVHFFEYGKEKSWSPLPAVTDRNGYFDVFGIPPGTYDIAIKNYTCLSEIVTGVELTDGATTVVNFGTTREGDANNDNHVNILDVSSLVYSYLSSAGGSRWNPHCDFNRDGHITILDVSALVSNFGKGGDLTLVPGAPPAKVALAQSHVDVNVTPQQTTVGFNENFSVTIWINDSLEENYDGVGIRLIYNTTYINATSVTDADSFDWVLNPGIINNTWNATHGLIKYDAANLGGAFNVSNPVCTVNFTSNDDTGTSGLEFIYIPADAATSITLAGNDILNWASVVNGTVEVVPGATLQGNVTFVGRGTPPNTKWVEPFVVKGFEAGNLTNELWNGTATTNNTGVFTLSGLTPGTYDIGIKNWTCLSELVTNVTLSAGMTTVVDFGYTREGDSNGNDAVTGMDFSLLSGVFNTAPAGNPNCDFNRDNAVTGMDFSLLAGNFGKTGDLQGD